MISGTCLAALAAEAILSYLVFSNVAYEMAESGQYNMREAYSSGPIGLTAKMFYAIFGLTAAIGVGAPVIALVSLILSQSKSPPPPANKPEKHP